MTGSTYNPTTVDQFDKTKLNFDGQGVIGSCAPSSTANMDYDLTDDMLLTGCVFMINDSNWGDFVNFQVIDATGALTGTPGTVLSQFASSWYVPGNNTNIELKIVYPAKVIAGMGLRVVYNNVGANAASFAMNYELHKVLI